jgi:hypothetical protein
LAERERAAANHFRATATREDAGSARSLAKIATSSSHDAVGWADATAKILSVKTVLLLGVARCRPPRRSPGFEPLDMLLLQVANASSSSLSPAGPDCQYFQFYGLIVNQLLSDATYLLVHCYKWGV